MSANDPMATSDGSILGLDNVRLELPLAGLGSRLLAAVVDNLVLFLLLIVWLFGGGLLIGILGLGTSWGVALILVGMFLLQWGYFAILEIATQGRTPGKMLLGLRVVSRLGGQPTVMSLLIRNLLRAIDLVTGVPMLVFDSHRRRLGDLVAGTLVLHQQTPEAVAAEPALLRHPEGWNAREVAVVESFLRRADRLDPNRAEPMAEQLLGWIARRDPEFWNAVAPTLYPTADPVARLRQVLQHPAQEPSSAPVPAASGIPIAATSAASVTRPGATTPGTSTEPPPTAASSITPGGAPAPTAPGFVAPTRFAAPTSPAPEPTPVPREQPPSTPVSNAYRPPEIPPLPPTLGDPAPEAPSEQASAPGPAGFVKPEGE